MDFLERREEPIMHYSWNCLYENAFEYLHGLDRGAVFQSHCRATPDNIKATDFDDVAKIYASQDTVIVFDELSVW